MRHSRNANLVFFTPLILAIFMIPGCSWWQPTVHLRSVHMDVVDNANDNTPIAVDFVAVKDPDLLGILQSLTAAQWFAQKAQIARDYPQQFMVWSLELVPGTRIDKEKIPLAGEGMEGLLMFAGYSGEGAHRLRLDQVKDLRLTFESDEVHIAKQ